MSVGTRLREERERLRFSREDLAEKAGVHRNTLARYETDKTELGAGFIETMRALRIDVEYVLFGIPNPEALVDCPYVQEQHLDLKYAFTLQRCRDHAAGGRSISSAWERRWFEACNECPKNPIKHGLPIAQTTADIDGPLLLALLEGLETALLGAGLAMVPAKKAQAVVMLYRASKASGKMDQKMIEEAVKLAAG